MYRILIILLLSINILQAQKLPRFENDTLFTKCGYKIYKGQILAFAEGTGNDGKFKYIKLRGSDNPNRLKNKKLVVERVSKFYTSGLGNDYIKIRGRINRTNKKDKSVRFKMIFEKAIGEFPGVEPEIIIPKQFRNLSNSSVADEIEKLYKLYQDGVINKEEFETQKKKLLEE